VKGAKWEDSEVVVDSGVIATRNLRDLSGRESFLIDIATFPARRFTPAVFCSKSLRDFMRAAADLIMRLLRG
jgi:hypothetical protein